MTNIDLEEFKPIININLAFCVGLEEKNLIQDGKKIFLRKNNKLAEFSYEIEGFAEKLVGYYQLDLKNKDGLWEIDVSDTFEINNVGFKAIGENKDLVVALAVISKFSFFKEIPKGFIKQEINKDHSILVHPTGKLLFDEFLSFK